MEFRQLEYFRAVCEELHFTRAADKLGISQPTLSHQIKAIEDELGMPLFDRIGKKIYLTEAGAALKTQTSVVFQALSGAKEQIEELKEGKRGTISIGSLPGELNYLVGSLLVDFNARFPRTKIKIVAAEDVMERVLLNELDVAVTILPVNDERLARIPLYYESFYLTVSADHPLAGAKEIDFADALKQPIIMFPQDHKCRQLVESTCKATGEKFDPFIETNTIDSVFNLVRSGVGASILSKSLFHLRDDGSLRAIPIVNPTLCRQIVIIHYRDKFLNQAARAFIDLTRSFVQDNGIGDQVPCAPD